MGRVLDIKPEQGGSVIAPLSVVIARGECCTLAPFKKKEQLSSPPCRVSGLGEIAMTRDRLTSETSMPAVKLRASVILGAFAEAQSELVGKAVVLTDGKAGTVEGSTNSTVCESRLGDTMESGPSQPSNSPRRTDRLRRSDRFGDIDVRQSAGSARAL